MRALVLLSIAALAALAGWYQQGRLEALGKESIVLRASLQQHASSPSRGTRQSRVPESVLNEIDPMMRRMAAMREPSIDHPFNAGEQAESAALWKDIQVALAALDHKAVFQLIQRFMDASGVPLEKRIAFAQHYVTAYIESNPAEALELLGMLGDFPWRDKALPDAFRHCAVDQPERAVRWFEEEFEKKNPLTADPAILNTMFVAMSRVDPTLAVARLTQVPKSDAYDYLGQHIAGTLRTPREHLAFLEAMNHLGDNTPNASLLRNVRHIYLQNLERMMPDWTFEDATSVMEGFSSGEKISLMQQMVHRLPPTENERWATWLSKIRSEDERVHPINQLISHWAEDDPAAARKWIEARPADDKVRIMVSDSYLRAVAVTDPIEAMRFAQSLPVGKPRNNAVHLAKALAKPRTAP